MTQQQVPTKGRGCFFYGCLTSVILAVLLGIAGIWGFSVLRKAVKEMATQYSQTTPMELPKVEVAPDDQARLQTQVKAFEEALEKQQAIEPLVLTGKDINVLIATSPGFKQFKGKLYVDIDGDQFKGQLSVPTDVIPLINVKGRYLNGEATFKGSLEDGVLIVTVRSMKVAGQELPDQFMQGLRQQNLAKDAYNDPDTAKLLHNLESIQVKDGKLIVKAKASK